MTDQNQGALSRRRLLELGATGVLGLSAAQVLAGCGGGSSKSSPSSNAGPPKKGGRLTVGLVTGGKAETIAPSIAINTPDFVRVLNTFDPLFKSKNLQTEPGLALSAEPNADATVWTFKLRDGVTWHDGSEFSADDVVYTIHTWSDPSHYGNASSSAMIDFRNVKKVDRLTVQVPLIRPVSTFPAITTWFNFVIVKDGSTPTDLIGTGPFRLDSFTPGTKSEHSANRDYWDAPRPYLDKLTIDSSFVDDSARFNAVLSGRVDVMMAMPFALAKQQLSQGQLKIANAQSPSFQAIVCRCDDGPTKDVRVRQALRLLVDRKSMVDEVFLGLGTVGNDIPGNGVPYFASDLVRNQNVDEAKSLLKQAGVPDLRLTLDTSTVGPGVYESAQLFQQQAKEAGVSVNLNKIDPGIYFTGAGGYLKYPFSQTFWFFPGDLALFYIQAGWSKAPYNETHFGSPEIDNLLFDAMAATDDASKQQRWHAYQEKQFNEGGYLVWGQENYLDGMQKNVEGLVANKSGWLNGFALDTAWLS